MSLSVYFWIISLTLPIGDLLGVLRGDFDIGLRERNLLLDIYDGSLLALLSGEFIMSSPISNVDLLLMIGVSLVCFWLNDCKTLSYCALLKEALFTACDLINWDDYFPNLFWEAIVYSSCWLTYYCCCCCYYAID